MITITISDIATSFRRSGFRLRHTRFSFDASFAVKSTTVLFTGKKFLFFSEALYEKVPPLQQHLLTLFRRQGHSDTSQHPGHTREQQLKLRHLFFSRLTRHKWQQPLTIGFSQRLNPFSHGQRLSCKLWPEGGEHTTQSWRIRVGRT